MGFGGTSGGSGSISSAADAALNNPIEANVLSYNATSQKWVNRTISGGAKGDNGDLAVTISPTSTVVWNSAGSPYDISSLAFPSTIHRVISTNITISTFPAPASSVSGTLSFVFKLSSSASSSYTITWPTDVYKDANQDFSLTSSPGEFTIFHAFWTGSKWTLTKQGDYDFGA